MNGTLSTIAAAGTTLLVGATAYACICPLPTCAVGDGSPLPETYPEGGVIALPLSVYGGGGLMETEITATVSDPLGLAVPGVVELIDSSSAVWRSEDPLVAQGAYSMTLSCTISGIVADGAYDFSIVPDLAVSPDSPVLGAEAFFVSRPTGAYSCCTLPSCYQGFGPNCERQTICEHCAYAELESVPRLRLDIDPATDSTTASQLVYVVEWGDEELARFHAPDGQIVNRAVELPTRDSGPWCVTVTPERISDGLRGDPVEVCDGAGVAVPPNEPTDLPVCTPPPDAEPVESVSSAGAGDSGGGGCSATGPSAGGAVALLILLLLTRIIRRPEERPVV